MKSIQYTVSFFTYWHCSSGVVGGPDASNTVIKDESNLPFIPGKTLKGLIREAAEDFLPILYGEVFSRQFVVDIFGPDSNAFDYDNQSSHFANATLPAPVKAGIEPEDTTLLYDLLASTAIDKEGQAKDGSLRQIEVCVPMSLTAKILDFPDKPQYLEALEKCLMGIKQMGSDRTRGLGRCQFSLIQNEEA